MSNLTINRDAELRAAESIVAAADTENRPLTAEEQTRCDEHITKAESINATIKTSQRAAELRAASPGLEQRAGAQVHDRAEDKPFASFGEYLMSVRNAAEPGLNHSDVDPRLRKFDVRLPEVRAAQGLNETTLSDGGFLVSQDNSMELINRAYGESKIFSRCRRTPISPRSNGVKLPYVDETSRANGSRWGGVQAYWGDEAETVTATKPKLGRLELNLKKLIGICYATDELMDDAAALGDYISQAFTEEFAFKLDDAVIRGTGTGTPLGILNSEATVSISKETSQAAATIKLANVNKMYARMWSRSLGNSVWFINQDVFPQLELLTVDVKNVAGTENVGGSAVYVPAGGVANSPLSTLKGRPVIPVEHCETLGTVGDIIFADLSQYRVIQRDMQAASSLHVRFLYSENCFRFVHRVDGQPSWKMPLTPYKGSNTVSPFITLATRA